jgi:HlyD family secretion protein
MNDLRADLASLKIDRSGPKPPNKLLRALLVLAAVSGIGFAGLRVGRPFVEDKLFQVEVAATEISTLSPSQAAVDLTSTGYVVPQLTAKVSSNVIGRVTRSNAKEGQRVKLGDLLFELDGSAETALVAASRARVGAASARILTFRAQRRELDLEIDRQKKLVEAGAAARAPLEDLQAKAATLDAQIRAAEAEMVASSADTDSAQVQLSHLKIVAPIDGTVMTKPAAIGDVTNPGVPLLELADFTSLLVEADVSEGRLAVVKAGGPCEIVLDAIPSERFQGEVVEVGPRLNRSKATATVKVRFKAPPAELRPEMSARVSFLQKPLDEAQLKETAKNVVPAAAVVERAGGKAVYVLDAGKVKLVPVTLGEALGSGFVLKEGPAPGTRVVKDPPRDLADGQSVKEKTS